MVQLHSSGFTTLCEDYCSGSKTLTQTDGTDQLTVILNYYFSQIVEGDYLHVRVSKILYYNNYGLCFLPMQLF